MVEAYVRRSLAPEDCAAFEEHYFQCNQCFDEVQVTEKLVQGVGYAVAAGLLDQPVETAPQSSRQPWLLPFLFAGASSAVFASVLAFVVIVQEPRKDARLDARIQELQSQARESQARLAELTGAEANVPVAILTATRSAEPPNQVTLGAQARRVLLWIDVPPQPAGTRFSLTIGNQSLNGLERNATGALAVSVPVSALPAGSYQVRLFKEQAPGQLVSEYRLNISR